MTRFAADITLDPAAIARLTDDVSEFLRTAGIDSRAVHHVALVVDEILNNVATHGGSPDSKASLVLTIEPDRIAGQIRDCGAPFDPRSAAEPNLATSPDEREIGGLGLFLVQRLTSALDYRRDGNQNWTTFYVPRAANIEPTGP
jgi:serine/threonine-protein kinase RsbW